MTSCLRGEECSENETYENQKEIRRKRSIKKKVFASISATPPRTQIKSPRTPSYSTDKSNDKVNIYLKSLSKTHRRLGQNENLVMCQPHHS